MSFRPKRHKLSTNSNPMTLISEGGIELTDATAFLAKAKEKESANGGGGAHKRHQGCNSIDIIRTSPNLTLIMFGVLRHI